MSSDRVENNFTIWQHVYLTQTQEPPSINIDHGKLTRDKREAEQLALRKVTEDVARMRGLLPPRRSLEDGKIAKRMMRLSPRVKRWIEMPTRNVRSLSANDVEIVETVRSLPIPRSATDGDTTDDEDLETIKERKKEWDKARAAQDKESRAEEGVPSRTYRASYGFWRRRQRDGSYRRDSLEQQQEGQRQRSNDPVLLERPRAEQPSVPRQNFTRMERVDSGFTDDSNLSSGPNTNASSDLVILSIRSLYRST